MVKRVRNLLEDVEDILPPAVDPELSRALVERRRGARFRQDLAALDTVTARLSRLRAAHPGMEVEEGPLVTSARTTLLREGGR